MTDTIIGGKMTTESLIETINDHYNPEDNLEVWIRIHKVINKGREK
jgi:hypothetical protein